MSIADDIQSLATRYPAIAEQVYAHRCSIVRDTEANDGRGGWISTPSTVASNLPCAFIPSAKREVVVAGQIVGVSDGDVWLQAQVSGSVLDIRAKDRIVIAAQGADPQRTVEIIYPAAHQGILFQVAVSERGASA